MFRKVRAAAFGEHSLSREYLLPLKTEARLSGCITFVSLVWLVLLSLDLFLRWDVSDPAERELSSCSSLVCLVLRRVCAGSLSVILVLINTITVIMLPTLYVAVILCEYDLSHWCSQGACAISRVA